jgi:Zn-dependent M28 family amino/carboxypeptidase
VDRFKALGLKPANGESFLQAVPMVETQAAGATLTVGGKGRTLTLQSGRDMVIWTRRGVPEVALKGSDLVFAGYGIVAPQFAWNDYAGIDVRGKTVLVLVNDPGHAAHDPRIFHGDATTEYGLWTYKVAEAGRQGAAGVLLVHDFPAAGFGWQAVVNAFSAPQLAAPAAAGDAGRAAVEGWVSRDAAAKLLAQAGFDLAALTEAATHPGFAAVPLGLNVDAGLKNTVRTFNSSNVIGVLPGRSHHHEFIIYTAHWDHLGRGGAGASGPIYPGAVDNASGTAGLLMLARSFARSRPPPERSIVFLALTGGEAGLLGSDWYCEHPLFPLRDTVAVLNLDSLRIGGPTRDLTVFGYGASELDLMLRDAAALQGRELHADPLPGLALFYRSDQFSFARRGIPVVYAQGGIDDSARGPAYGRLAVQDYYAHRYRQPADAYAPDWDVRGTLEDIHLYFAVGQRLAQTRRFPNWYPASEFRAARDQSRSGASE